MMAESDRWMLASVADNVSLIATESGILLHIVPSPPDTWRDSPVPVRNPTTRLGRILGSLIPQMVDLGLAERCDEGFLMSHDAFAEIEEYEIGAFGDIIEWAPFSIVLESTGWLGGETYRYVYDFYLGTKPIRIDRLGSIVRRNGRFYRLNLQTLRLLVAIDKFNALTADQKASSAAFIRFAEIK